MSKSDKPWGWENLIEKNEDYVMKELFMTAGNCCSVQYHEKKHETVYVVSGKLLLHYGDTKDSLQIAELGPGQSFVVPPGLIHRMEAAEDSLYLEASTPQLDDVIRLQDKYGRA
jgi:mannose-6-phosphate isomerase-like protein (cupin superfamily)